MKKDTGLKDDYGTPINDGDTIEWAFMEHGLMLQNKDGSETFFGCVGSDMITRETTETKVIKYEVRGDIAGYFLDRPKGISTTFITKKPKCKVIKI